MFLLKFYFSLLFPFGEGISTNLNPVHTGMLCAKFGWIWLSGFGPGKMKMQKVYHNANDNNANNEGLQTNLDQNSSLKPSAQVSLK